MYVKCLHTQCTLKWQQFYSLPLLLHWLFHPRASEIANVLAQCLGVQTVGILPTPIV